MPIQVPVTQTGLEASIEAAAKKAGRSLSVNLGKSAKSVDMLSQPLGRITGKADEFTKSMEAANARVLAFGASVGVLTTITKAFKDLVVTTIQVEKQLASINSILNRDAAGLASFKKEIFDVARTTEQSFETVSTAALELSRQGLGAEEVLGRLNDAMILSRLSGLGAAESVSGLTAAINSFKSEGLDSSEILNKLSAAAISAAVSERDLIEAIKRSASVANQAGVSFDELVGVVTAVQQATARGGSVIGNSFKTIFTRLQSFQNLTTLQNLGVQVEDAAGKVLPATKLIENLSGALAELPKQQAQDIATGLVGRFQIAPFLAILNDYQSETKAAIKITDIAANATTEAYERNIALNRTLSAAINAATVNLQELATTLGEIGVTDGLRNVLTFFNTFVENLQDLLEGEGLGSDFARGIVKGIGNVLSGPGIAIFAAIVGKLTVDLAKFGIQSINTFFGMSQASKEIAATQGQIASTLLGNAEVQKTILSIENSTLSTEQKRVAQAKFFTSALNEQLAVMSRMQGIAASIAPSVVAGTRGGRGRAKAGGYIPSFAGGFGAEVRDIAMGVGGAPPTAKAVTIPNFNFGGGVVGPVVANDSEFLVPNFGGGGGSAIFNQNMVASMGLPPGARKINASEGLFSGRGTSKGIIRDDRFAMVVPQQIGTKQATGRVGNKTYGFNVFGFNSGQLKARNDAQLKSDVTKFGIKLASEEAMTLTGGTPKAGKISKLSNAGAIGGLAGTVFETAISALTKQSPEFDSKQTQTFDFFGSEIAGLRKLYPNIPASVFFTEAKIATNTRLNNSMAAKMDKFGAGTTAGTLSKKATKEFIGTSKAPGLFLGAGGKKGLQKATGQKFTSMAGGYIPNFSNGSEPIFTTPRGRQINLKQALAGFGGVEIQKDAQKHMANLAASTKKVTEANKKLASTSGQTSNMMFGVLAASSFLSGSFSDMDSSVGRLTQSVAKAGVDISSFAIGAQAIGSIGQGGKLGKVTKGLGKLGIVLGALNAAGGILNSVMGELSGRHDFTASALSNLAASADNAASFLNRLSAEEKEEIKKDVKDTVFELGGIGAGLLKKTPDADFGGLTPFARKAGTVFEVPETGKTLLERLDALRAAGMKTGEIGTLAEQLGKSAVNPANPFGGAFDFRTFIPFTRTFGKNVIPEKSADEMTEAVKRLLEQQTDRFDKVNEAFEALGPQALAEFAMGKGKGRESIREMLTKSFAEDFVQREMGKFTEKAGQRQDPFGTPAQTVEFSFFKERLKTLAERAKARQAEIKIEERLIKLQEIQGTLSKDELSTAKISLSERKFQDQVINKTNETFSKLLEKAKAYSVAADAETKARKIVANLTFDQISDDDKRGRKIKEVVAALGLENELISENTRAYNEALTNQIVSLETAKNREQAEIRLTRELEKSITPATLLAKEARDIETALEGGAMQLAKVRGSTVFDRLSASATLGAATNRMLALDAGDIQEVRRIDLAEKLAKSLVSASQAFSENIGNALVDAVAKGESLGNTLRSVAADFFNTMSKALMNNAINNALNMGGSFFGFNTGGQVRGGSGVKDDVPALLTGGEFVMSKKAVQNYGAGFMGALNSGSVPKYANGGLFTPGTYGQGAIKGSSNLLNFATQSYTGGLQDMFLSGAGLAGLSLEPQSGRLTMFGRRNSPAFQREQESKRKAFSLFSQQYTKNQELREAKESSSSNLLGSLLGFGVSLGASTLFGGGLSSLFTKKATGGSVPYSAGIDSVPTMLSGGEFVMNAAATQRLGAGNLAALNAGATGGTGSSSQIVGKLDQLNETIASSNTEINITVNSNGTENTDSPNAPEQQRGLATKIKDVVRQVIEDEKRLGGSLRMA